MTGQPAPAPDVAQPEWLRRAERGSTTSLKLAVGLAFTLGRPLARLLLPVVCGYFLIFSTASRRASRGYLARALGRRATLIDVFRHFHSFAACLLDRAFLLNNRDELFEITLSGEQIAADILAQGSGCILLGAHLGSFEVLRAAGRGRPGLRVKMVMYEENARKISAVLNAINPALAKDVISLGKAGSLLAIQHCLENGDFVGVLADRSLTEERQIVCPFLGKPAQFPANPFRMIAMLQKPVILMFGLYRGGNRYDVHIEPFLAGESPGRASEAEIGKLVGRYVERLEHFCRIAPYNWFNFYDVWK